MNIIDLRQTTVRQLEPLLLEEASHWRDELHWDYRSALDLIKRFLDAHALSGYVAAENNLAVGYSFYVLEDYKGLIGGLYVSSSQNQEAIGRRPRRRSTPRSGIPPAHAPVHAARSAEASGQRPDHQLRPAARSLARPLLRAMRQVDLSLLRQSHRRRHQRSVPFAPRRPEVSEEHHPAARLRTVSAKRFLRSASSRKR